MLNMKKVGFTLPEVLITLAIVGALACLVIPSIIKDTNSRAMMALLEGTVSNLNNAVQNELTSKGTSDVTSTRIFTNPAQFLSGSIDTVKTCSSTSDSSCYSSSYKTLDGSAISIWKNAPVLLKNGVTIDILPAKMVSDFSNTVTDADGNDVVVPYALPVSIDLNGAKDPNILGVDRFMMCVYLRTDSATGIHSGDVGGCLRNGVMTALKQNEEDSESETTEKELLKTFCKSGHTEACFVLAERTGFDPDYINK